MTNPTTGAGLKQWRSNTFPLPSLSPRSPTLSNFLLPFSSSWGSLHWKEGLSDEARRPVEVRMCSKMASKPLKKSWRLPPTARSTRSFSSKQRPKNSSPKCSRSSQNGTPGRERGCKTPHVIKHSADLHLAVFQYHFSMQKSALEHLVPEVCITIAFYMKPYVTSLLDTFWPRFK